MKTAFPKLVATLMLMACILGLSGCDSISNMSSSELPEGWSVGDKVDRADYYTYIPETTGPSRFIGYRQGDSDHRWYTAPENIPPADIVKVFKVGSHGAESYSYDEAETIELVASITEAIHKIAPAASALQIRQDSSCTSSTKSLQKNSSRSKLSSPKSMPCRRDSRDTSRNGTARAPS